MGNDCSLERFTLREHFFAIITHSESKVLDHSVSPGLFRRRLKEPPDTMPKLDLSLGNVFLGNQCPRPSMCFDSLFNLSFTKARVNIGSNKFVSKNCPEFGRLSHLIDLRNTSPGK